MHEHMTQIVALVALGIFDAYSFIGTCRLVMRGDFEIELDLEQRLYLTAASYEWHTHEGT